MAPITPDVLDSPAVAILAQLKADGFTVQLAPDRGMVIAPGSHLTPERKAEIRQHKDALTMLLRCYSDAGVTERRTAFECQLALTPAPRVPAFLFTPDVPYQRGVCFSCGDGLPTLRFSRCWRCALAWRLACRVPIQPALADVLDAAKVLS